jgi:Mg2+ and Co2+ transporter CorA
MTVNAPQAAGLAAAAVPCLVWAYRFDAEGRATWLDEDAAFGPPPAEGWVWLHFDLADTRSAAVLGGLPDLPPEALEVLEDSAEMIQLAAEPEMIAGIAPDFIHGAEPDPRKMTTWRFAMQPRRLVTARRRQVRTLGALHEALRAGRRFPGVLHLFDAVIDGLADSMALLVRRMSERLDFVEDALLDRDEQEYEALGHVRRDATRLARLMPPLGAMLRGIVAHPPAWFTEDALEECAYVAQRLESLAGDIAALQNRAHALQDEIASRQAAQTNQQLALLSVITALLMPPTLISGIFGMNVARVPFVDEHSSGFPAAMALMVLSVVVMLVVLRRLKLI